MPKTIDIGKRFHRLTVTGKAPSRDGTFWVCLCDCGQTKVIGGGALRSGSTKSCGCWRRDRIAQANTKHGSAKRGQKTRTFRTWMSMIERCTTPTHHAYKNYGGRGITVSDRWMSYPNFLADMGERPKGKSIDRINNDGNYEMKNCRWATRKQQANNTRRTKAQERLPVQYRLL